MMRHQRGVTTVEFAIVGAVLFMVLFSVIEFGRALFVANALVEGTRRGARVAAVCPIGDTRAAQVTIMANGGGASQIAPDLTTDDVAVSYLDQNGAVIANPAAAFTSIQYVQVRIVGYQMELMIPFVMPELLMPEFAATLPKESLGYSPTQEAFVAYPAV
jgi:Flp pilus assembly protein TadG